MNWYRWVVLSLLVVPLLTGMGSLGGGPEGTVPKTEENIRVRLTDREGVVTELSQFSLEGKTMLEGERGSAALTIFFHNMQSAEFAPVDGKDDVLVMVRLKEGGDVQLTVRKRRIFYGSTGFGALQIRARDVRRLELL